MTRIEKNTGLEQKIDEVTKDVKDVKRETRQRHPWLACSVVVLILFFSGTFWVAWSVASTGLVNIPVLTSFAYQIPQPTRSVSAGVPVETILQELITSTITSRIYQGNGELLDRSIQAVITEESLTASLRSLSEISGFDWFDSSRLQVVIDPSVGVEVYAPISLTYNDQSSAVISIFELAAKDGAIVVTPTMVSIGSLEIPDFVIASFFKPFLESELAKVNSIMVGYAQISSVEVLSGELQLTGDLSVTIQK